MQTQQLPTMAVRSVLILPGARASSPLSSSTPLPQVVGGAALLGAAAIHASVLPGHYAEWTLAGWFFVALQVSQTVAAVTVVLAPVRRVQLLALLVTVGPLTLWAVTRTVGLPLGPAGHQGREVVGVADTACAILEVAALAAVVTLHLRGRSGDCQHRFGHAATTAFTVAAAAALVAGVTAIGVLGAESHGGHDPSGSVAVHPHP